VADVFLPVLRRFPGKQNKIRRLALASPSFRSLCNDFGEASAALGRHEASDRDGLRAEYRALVTDLAAEIEAALARAEYH
jgi:hypothetical protein